MAKNHSPFVWCVVSLGTRRLFHCLAALRTFAAVTHEILGILECPLGDFGEVIQPVRKCKMMVSPKRPRVASRKVGVLDDLDLLFCHERMSLEKDEELLVIEDWMGWVRPKLGKLVLVYCHRSEGRWCDLW